MTVLHRLFFALQPAGAARARIGRHRDGVSDIVEPVIDPHLHVTLAVTALYEEFPAHAAHRLHKLAAGIIGEPVAISLERQAGSPTSVALRPRGRSCRELRALQKDLAGPMARHGLLLAGYAFRPHVTLGYRKGKPASEPIEPIAWESHEFVLIHSEVGAKQHKTLGRWPLTWRQGRLF